MDSDSPLARIREARHSISEECGHDPKRLVEYYMQLQQRHADRLVRSVDTPSKETSPDSEPTDRP